jgi:hypothetical protein
MLDNRMQCMPGDEVWLVGERRSTGEQKYYLFTYFPQSFFSDLFMRRHQPV